MQRTNQSGLKWSTLSLNEKDIIGFQTTLKYDQDKLKLIDVKNGILSESHFGNHELLNGQLNISYNNQNPINSSKNDPLFILLFKSKSIGYLSQMLKVSLNGLDSEAYTKDLEIKRLVLDLRELQY